MGLPCMAIGYLTTVCNFYLVMGNIVFLLQAVTQKKKYQANFIITWCWVGSIFASHCK